MTSTDFSAVPGSAASGPWQPPHRLFHLYSLLVLTLGLYRTGWAFGIARDFRDRLGWAYRLLPVAILSIVPVADSFVLFNLSKKIEELRKKSGAQNAREVVAISALLNLLGGLTVYYLLKNGVDGIGVALGALYLLLLPAPTLMVQAEYNALKSRFGNVGWKRPANTLLLHHKLAMAIIPVLSIACAAFALWDELPAAPAPTLAAGEKIFGKNKGYALTVPAGGWLPLPEGRRAIDADLELSGQDGEAILIAFAGCDGATLDGLVESRRIDNSERLAGLEIVEDRRFDAKSFVPISVARYSGIEALGQRGIYWITTAVDGRLQVEVIVEVLGEGPEDEKAAKSIVESLEILGEDKGCATTG